jgi:hypothetical protein
MTGRFPHAGKKNGSEPKVSDAHGKTKGKVATPVTRSAANTA